VLCMYILHNTIANRCELDRKTAKAANTREDENRRHRIRNRSPREPVADRRGSHTRNSHRTHERHSPHRTPSTTATRRNLQRRNPKTLGRKLVLRAARLKRSPQRNGTQRIPLRPHSRSPRPNRFGERWHTHARRKTTQIPIRTKKTPPVKLKIMSVCSII